jgi:hypothetical protein
MLCPGRPQHQSLQEHPPTRSCLAAATAITTSVEELEAGADDVRRPWHGEAGAHQAAAATAVMPGAAVALLPARARSMRAPRNIAERPASAGSEGEADAYARADTGPAVWGCPECAARWVAPVASAGHAVVASAAWDAARAE